MVFMYIDDVLFVINDLQGYTYVLKMRKTFLLNVQLGVCQLYLDKLWKHKTEPIK